MVNPFVISLDNYFSIMITLVVLIYHPIVTMAATLGS